MNKSTSYLMILLALWIAGPSTAFAQSQPPCSGSVAITDATQAQPGVLAIVTNSGQASFTVTGPATYHGSGYYWVQQGIPAGAYTINWDVVPGCAAPRSETKTTNARGSVAFAGNYTETGASQNRSTSAPIPAPVPAPAPLNNAAPAVTPNNPSSAIPSSPPPISVQQSTSPEPRGFFARIFNAVRSIFGRIFGRHVPAPPPPSAGAAVNFSGPNGSSADELQGLWKVERIRTFDPTINDFRQTQAGGNYTEFKGDKVCPGGTLGPNDTPQPCPHYETFRLSGDQIIMTGDNPFTIHWKLSGNALELSMEPKTAPTTPNSPQKQKITLSKTNQKAPIPIPSPSAVINVDKPTPAPAQVPETARIPAAAPTFGASDLQGVWKLVEIQIKGIRKTATPELLLSMDGKPEQYIAFVKDGICRDYDPKKVNEVGCDGFYWQVVLNGDKFTIVNKGNPAASDSGSITLAGGKKEVAIYRGEDTHDIYHETAFKVGRADYDIAMPKLSAVGATGINAHSATITWKTDQEADTNIDYKDLQYPMGSAQVGDSHKVTDHSYPVTGLKSGTKYQFKVFSCNAAGCSPSSAPQYFTTNP